MKQYLNHLELITLINNSNEVVNNRPLTKKSFFANYFEVEVNSDEWKDLAFINLPEIHKLN